MTVSLIGEMLPQITERHPPPPEQREKIEGGAAEEKDCGEKGSIDTKSSDDKNAVKVEGGGTGE